MFLLDNSESMLDFPQYLPEAFTPGYSPAISTTPGTPGYDGDYGHFINTGCSDPALVAAMSWFDKNSPDTTKNGSVIYDNDSDFGSTPFFQPDRFYHARGRRIAWESEDFPWSLGALTRGLDTPASAQTACYQITNWKTSDGWYDSPVMKECEQCLASKGWWRGPLISAKTAVGFNDSDYPVSKAVERGEEPPPPEAYRKWIVSGRVLNVRPPKFVVARKVLKDVISSVPNARMGVASFTNKDHGWYDPPRIHADLRPSCDESFPTVNETALDRRGLQTAVNRVSFSHNERNIGESLFGLGGYFSSQRRDQIWENWFTNPINPGYFGWPGCCNGGTVDNVDTGKSGAGYAARSPDEWLKPPVPEYGLQGQPFENLDYNKRNVCFNDQTSAVIVLTDGAPRYDNSVPITKMMELLKAKGARHPDGTLLQFDPANPETNPNVGGVNYCDQFEKAPGVNYTKADCDYTAYNWPHGLGVGNKNFMDDVALFLSKMDLRGDLAGVQSVRTFVVGYGDDHPMLQSIARAGKGQFYRADNSVALRNALLSAFNGVSAPASAAP